MGEAMRTILRLAVAVTLAATAYGAAADRLELRGKVRYGAARYRTLRVALFGVESPYTASTLTDPAGEFRFRGLVPGSYTVSVIRRGLGEVRRSVVVTPALADKKGVVRTEIVFSPAEAATGSSGGTVSKNQLTVPQKARNKYAEAERRLNKRDIPGAKSQFEEAARIAPQFTSAWNMLGVLAYQGRDLHGAEGHFRHALGIESDAFEPTVNLGGVLLAQNRLEEALQWNEKAVDLRPRDPLANAQLGMTLYYAGKFAEAEPYLETAKRADPAHFTKPQLFLAGIYERRGERNAAARELADLLQRYPDIPQAEQLRLRLSRLEGR
jgi:Tfp pilus assembly protein PilF